MRTDISVRGTGERCVGFDLVPPPPPQTVLQSPVEERDCPLPPPRMQQGGEHLWQEMHPGLLAWGDAQRVHVRHGDLTAGLW